MENNLSLSPKVKAYFVHALKGIGIRDFDQAKGESYEMSEAEIANFLDNATPLGIFEKISLATTHQLQNDAQGDRRLQSCSAFKRQAVSNALADNEFNSQGLPNLEKERCDNFVNEVCNFNNECCQEFSVKVVIATLKAGISEQKIFTSSDKATTKQLRDEALAFWDKISDSKFETLNAQQSAKNQMSKEEYHSQLLFKDMWDKTAFMFGNDAEAKKFLESKFDPKAQNFLKVSDSVLQKAKLNCKTRQGRELQMQDVMLSLMEDYSVEQTITYLQTRSQEQKTFQANGDKNITNENKLGNLMGKDGRKMVDKAAINFDKDKKDGKKGKKTWKGYKKLFDRMYGFFKDYCFHGIMSGEFTARYLREKGSVFVSTERNQNIKPWEVKFEKMPEQLQSQNGMSSAESFYKRTKARMLADKMRNANLTIILNDPLISDEKRAEVNAQVEYLNYRIAMAETKLDDLARIDKDDSLLQNPDYFKQLESQILNEKFLDKFKKPVEKVKKEEAQQSQRRRKNKKIGGKKRKQSKNQKQQQDNQGQEQEQKESAEYLAVESLVNIGLNHTANEEMWVALQEFEALSQGTQTPAKRMAKCSMARELFGLSAMEVPDDAEVEKIAECFEQNKLSKLKSQLTTCTGLKGQTNQNNVEQTFAEIQNFVQDDLKINIFRDQYNAYLVGQNAQKVMQDAVDELGR